MSSNSIARRLAIRWKLLRTMSLRSDIGKLVASLDDQRFVLVSNNCLAGMLYEFASRRKQTPTAGLYFEGSAFPDFLDDLANGDLERWKTLEHTDLVSNDRHGCPSLITGDKSGIVFLHYRDAGEATRKWNSRMPRLEDRTPVILASPRDGIDVHRLKLSADAFRHVYVGPDPSPPADEFALDVALLREIRDFLGEVASSA